MAKQDESTPLLWPQQVSIPGAGSFPAIGQYVHRGQTLNPSNFTNYYQRFTSGGGGGYGGTTPRPVTPQAPGTPQQQPQQSGPPPLPPPNPNAITFSGDLGKDPHSQFVALTGCPPTDAPPDFKYKPNERTLYGRAIYASRAQGYLYMFTASLINSLLLLQIILGAALTGLGGAGVPGWVVASFGAANTIIAGLVAYLKSRGQPMRARMFKDDLERVVDQIENSEVMWLGISKNVHGYGDIDTDAEVTVRSEVARLTRMLDNAIHTNTANNPDLYSAGGSGNDNSGGGGGGGGGGFGGGGFGGGGGGGGGGFGRGNPFTNFAAMGGMSDQDAMLANVPVMSVSKATEDGDPMQLTRKKTEEKKDDSASATAAKKPGLSSLSTANRSQGAGEGSSGDKGKAPTTDIGAKKSAGDEEE